MSTTGTTKRKSAGAFDIRNIIGALLLTYGLLLAGMGLFGDPEFEKTGGVNANLWAGLALLAAGVIFMVWARLRPILVPEHVEHADDDGAARPHGH